MTTARERMIELSGISGQAARAHFLSITQSTGATVFASSFMVFIDEPQLYVDLSKESKPVRQVSEAPVKPGKEVKRLFVTTIPEEITVTTQPNTLNIVEVKL